jgi:hypothetical protein
MASIWSENENLEDLFDVLIPAIGSAFGLG